MKYEVFIGLEIHAQVNSKTKFFCRCDNDSFGKQPNSNVCPVCMGFPGMLPVPNRQVIKKGIRAGLALGCTINKKSKFDRKQYFYPDNPKGYQITQFDEPISENGKIEITVGDEKKTIRITRMHLEDDAGKLTHIKEGTLCDYNRSGTPLMEIVSEPDMHTPEEARTYAEHIQTLMRYVDASDCDMEKGMMRFDASVSLRPVGAKAADYPDFYEHFDHGVLFPRVEIKNLNSFRALQAAIEYEIARQTEALDAGKIPEGDVTVGWIDAAKQTKLLRSKESAADYRYFPEPDIPPIVLEDREIERAEAMLPEMPQVRYQRYLTEIGLNEADALFLVNDKELSDFFEKVAQMAGDSKAASNFILSVMRKFMRDEQTGIQELSFSARDLADLLKLVKSGDISNKIAKDVFAIMFETGQSPDRIIEEKGWKQVNDTALLEGIVDKLIEENPSVVEDLRNGKDRALGFLIGNVMKQTKGQANPTMVTQMFKDKLKIT
jgi:aspartyl-tRNA(Asn)/glutamyl-tRNA(Gln) amidotransferase subunit B